MNKIFLILSTALLFSVQVSCQSNKKNKEAETMAQQNQEAVDVPAENGLEHAYVASGCFWCVEAVYESVKGVDEAISGYSGGKTQNPTYIDHADHAEAVEIIYDPNKVSFATLIDVYFGSQDVTQVNGQGPDRGKSYRSILFYQNDKQKQIIETKIAELEKKVGKGKVAAQVLPFQKFWKAEAYHQNYEKNNPGNPYIQNVSIPRINRFKSKFPELLKEGATH